MACRRSGTGTDQSLSHQQVAYIGLRDIDDGERRVLRELVPFSNMALTHSWAHAAHATHAHPHPTPTHGTPPAPPLPALARVAAWLCHTSQAMEGMFVSTMQHVDAHGIGSVVKMALKVCSVPCCGRGKLSFWPSTAARSMASRVRSSTFKRTTPFFEVDN